MKASTRTWIVKLLILSAVAVFVLFGMAWITARVCFPAFTMASASMESTILPGDTVLANRLATWRGWLPGRGDIVVFHFPLDRREVFVFRVIGVAGDRLKIRDKKLYRNSAEVSEPYALHFSASMDSYRDNFPSAPNFPLKAPAIDMLENHAFNGELVVPEGHYFVMGDNRDDAADSRYFGFIQGSDIIGRTMTIVASPRDPKRNWTAPR
jgi:signal peptidase I